VSETPDSELVSRYLRGDRTAFTALMERHERRVYNLAYRMLGRAEDAADASQETWLICLRKLSSFRGTSAFTTWLHRVAVNVCHDTLRRRAREAPAADEDLEPPPAPDTTESTAAAVDVQRALLEVPEEFRAAVILHDVQGVPYEEIAESLGAPLGTVKSRIHRGRLALARALRGEHPRGSSPSNLQETT
jgi:RNA polymerase sigma-70 factor (ECF subfamily)